MKARSNRADQEQRTDAALRSRVDVLLCLQAAGEIGLTPQCLASLLQRGRRKMDVDTLRGQLADLARRGYLQEEHLVRWGIERYLYRLSPKGVAFLERKLPVDAEVPHV